MMTRKSAKIIWSCVLCGLVLLMTGCDEYANYTPNAADLTAVAQLPAGPTKSAVQATAVARYVEAQNSNATVAAAGATARAAVAEQQAAAQREREQRAQMTAEAQAIEDARASEAAATQQAIRVQVTQQAIRVQATQQALDWNATATAEARNGLATEQAHQATATRQAENTTGTRQAADATATIQAQLDNAQATAVQATAASVARQDERERVTEPLRAFAPWLLLILGVVLAVVLGMHGWRLFEDRARLVRRDPDEGEPIMILSRERIALPMRQFGSYQDMTQGQESAPLLAPTVEAQAGATMRQQTSNAIQARQVGRVAQAKSKHGQSVVIPPSRAARREYHDPQLPPIRIRDAQGLRPLIEDVRRQIEEGTIEGELLC